MQEKEVIKVNRRIQVMRLDTRECYWSRIESIEGDALVIAAPMKHSTALWAPRGTEVRVDIPYEGKRYSFRGSVLRVDSGDLPTWTISYPGEMESINLRAFFRLDVSLEAAIKFPGQESVWWRCVITNLSGNGALFSVKDKFAAKVGDAVVLRLALPGEELMELDGKVVRCLEGSNDSGLVQLALHFPDIKPLDQDRIMKYLFEQQRKLRQRGLL